MKLLKDVFGEPVSVEDAGLVYPVRMKDYDEFISNAGIITLSYQHFGVDKEDKNNKDIQNLKLLDVVLLASIEEKGKKQDGSETLEILESLREVFKIVFRKNVEYEVSDEGLSFYIGEDGIVHRGNYDEVRKVIMKQNILHEKKVYKNKLMEKWAEKALSAREKNSVKMSMEDKLTTIAAFSGKHYNELKEYTIYQIYAEHARISKFKSYDLGIATIGHATNPQIEHFSESTDFEKSPYDDLFVSKDKKLKSTNEVVGD